MNKYIFFLFWMSLGLGAVSAQEVPGPDTLASCGANSSFLEKGIDRALLKQLDAQWQSYSAKNPVKANGRLSAEDPVLIVPVMFHIAHLGEPIGTGSNLSEGQIQASLATLNNIYRARAEFSNGNDTRIEFVLANCSGIDRANASGIPNYIGQGAVVTDYNQQQQIQQLFGTEQNQYLNIYVCHKLTGAGGWAYFGGRMFISIYDFPKKGERTSNTYVFAHEMGHSLFLFHTFEGDNSSFPRNPETEICPVNIDPLQDGDRIADTPPHKQYDLLNTPAEAMNPCTSQPFGIGLVKNYMAYYTSADLFTPGQIARMRFYLQNYLTNWINSPAIPTPNNQLTLTSLPDYFCAGSTVTVNISNSTGQPSLALLLMKGDSVVHYEDATTGSFSFIIPEKINAVTYEYTNYFNLTDASTYRLQLVAGCNRISTTPREYRNINSYQISIGSTDGEYLYNYRTLCPNAQITLRSNIRSNGENAPPMANASYDLFDFQWFQNGTELSGETNRDATTVSGGGTYQIQAKRKGCPVKKITSESFYIYSRSSPSASVADYIGYDQPMSQCAGGTVKLLSDYLSNTATYKWYRDGVLIPNETSRAFSATSTGTYTVETVEPGCSIYNNSNSRYINFGSSLQNVITAYFIKTTLCGNNDNAYLASQFSNNPHLSYQWLRNGQEIPGQTNYNLIAREGGIYSLRLRQGACESVSNSLTITVGSTLPKPRIIGPSSYLNGLVYNLTIERPFHTPVEILKDGVLYFGPTYNYSVSVSSSGVYTARIGSGDCMAESDPLVINFGNTVSPRITARDTVLLSCSNSTYSSYIGLQTQDFTNTVNLTYRWLRNGQELPTSNFYADKNYIFPYEPGTYQLRVTSGEISGLSNPIIITRTSNYLVDLIPLNNGSTNACSNSTLDFAYSAGLVYNSTLVWRKDGVVVSNQTGTTFTATESGIYTATYQGNGCTITSRPLTVTIGGPAPSATIQGIYGIRAGESASIPIATTANSSYFFKLSDGTEYVGQGGTTLVHKSPATSTTYTLASFGTHCGLSPNTSGFARVDLTKCPVGVLNHTLASGNWNNPATWSCGSVPTVLDAVRINSQHTIALPEGYGSAAKSIELQGQLQYNANTQVQLGQQ